MMYVIAYDVVDDAIRNRMSSTLEGYGYRVQHSVFECDLAETDLQCLMERLKKILGGPDAGNVRLYRLCRDCVRHSRGIGKSAPGVGDGSCIVI